MNKRISTLTISIALLAVILAVGSMGYMLIEQYSLIDAFFMTIITVSTVGFGEIKPLSPTGRIFTTFMIIFSFGFFAYGVSSITRFMVDGGFRNYFINKRTNRKVKRMNNHVILCGFGRNGKEAARALKEKGERFVVIETNEEIVNELRKEYNYLYVEGDATDDDVLRQAGVERAKSLITTLPNDADNLLVVLSTRSINKKIRIISRASHEWSDLKLKKAGANNVIMPDMVGGRRMAKLVASPDVVDFLEYMMRKKKGEVQLVELHCKDFACSFLQKTIGELRFKKISGVNIVGMKDKDGNYIFNPSPDLRLSENYQLFVMGTDAQVRKLKAAVFEEGTA